MKTPLTNIEIKNRNNIINTTNINTLEGFDSVLDDIDTSNIKLDNIEGIVNILKEDNTTTDKGIYELLKLIEKKIPSVENNIKTKINEIVNKDYEDDNININIDNNISNGNLSALDKYKNELDIFFTTYKNLIIEQLNEYSDYNLDTELINEITFRLIKIYSNDLTNVETDNTPTLTEPEPAIIGVPGVDNLESGINTLENNSFKKEQIIYLLRKLGMESEELADVLNKSTNFEEGFTTEGTDITSYDGLTTSQLSQFEKYNEDNKSSYSHNTVLIDPLKIISTVQDDVLSLLEKSFIKNEPTTSTYGNITTSTNPTTTNEGFDNSNRGSYLTNSNTDKIVNSKLNNLSYKSHQAMQPKLLKSNKFISQILTAKEKDIKEIKNRKYNNNKKIKEGFQDEETNSTQSTQKTAINLFDGFIKYSSNILTNMIQGTTNMNINELNSDKLTSYGVILILFSVVLYFISISS